MVCETESLEEAKIGSSNSCSLNFSDYRISSCGPEKHHKPNTPRSVKIFFNQQGFLIKNRCNVNLLFNKQLLESVYFFLWCIQLHIDF